MQTSYELQELKMCDSCNSSAMVRKCQWAPLTVVDSLEAEVVFHCESQVPLFLSATFWLDFAATL